MASHPEVVVGIDVGTTSMKAVAYSLDGDTLATAQQPTAWDVSADGSVELPATRMAGTAIDVIAEAAQRSGGTVIGIGITGMAETGVVVDASDTPVTPAIAWYDQRGKEELAALGPAFHREFSSVTGLAAKAECSLSKLLWHHQRGMVFTRGQQWLNLLEYIALALTGARATEPSLASRTGLLDQQTIGPWSTALDLIGVDADFLPPLLPAGTAVGSATGPVAAELAGAAVTVCGHDHLVASVGAGAAGEDALFDSCGTADVILRSVARTMTNSERLHLVENGLSAGRHCVPGATAVLGATRSGLVLGRILSLMGARTIAERQQIADAWSPRTSSPGASSPGASSPGASSPGTVVITEPPGWTNEVLIQVRDYIGPADLWAAAMDYVLAGTAAVLAPIAEVAGPYTTAHAAGGWAHLDGVFAGKASIMPGLVRSDAPLPGTLGAAMFAAQAAGATGSALALRLPTASPLQQASPPQQKEFAS